MTAPLRQLVELNPPTREFESAEPGDLVAHVPLEAVWPDGREDFTRRIDATTAGYTRFRRGDILLPKITPTFEAGRVLVANDLPTPIGLGTTELHILRCRAAVDPRYIAYLGRSQPFLQEGATTLQGVGNLRRVPETWLGKYPVPVTDQAAQRAIADFLDRETAKIDALIEKQSQLLTFTRQRLAEELTTLYPPDSKTVRLSRLTRTKPVAGCDYVAQPLKGSHQLRYVRTTDILGLFRLTSDEEAVGVTKAEAGTFTVEPGDLLVTRSGASVGTSYLHCTSQQTAYAGYLVRVRANLAKALPEYLAWWTKSRQFSDQIRAGCTQSTIENFSASKYSAMRVPAGKIQRQREIIAQAAAASETHEAVLTAVSRHIALAQERRSALITAAVTGQLEIPAA